MTSPDSPNFRALAQELVEKLDELNCNFNVPNQSALIERVLNELATPPPLAPDYIDPEHHGEDRELLQVFYAACNAEGGTADEIHLRGIRAVMAACPALSTPPPEPPTDKELGALADEKLWTIASEEYLDDYDRTYAIDFARAVLERWGQK